MNGEVVKISYRKYKEFYQLKIVYINYEKIKTKKDCCAITKRKPKLSNLLQYRNENCDKALNNLINDFRSFHLSEFR